LFNLEIKKCLRLPLAILLVALGLVGLAALGFDMPVLRQTAQNTRALAEREFTYEKAVARYRRILENLRRRN
jgi:hypothetical protein